MKRNKGMIVLGFLLALILIVAGFLAVTYYNHNRAPEVPETTVPSTDAVTTSATAYTGELELPVAGGTGYAATTIGLYAEPSDTAAHPDFPRLMADLEIYVNGVAVKQVQTANAIVDAVSATIMKQHNPGLTDPQLRQLIAAHINDDSFCRYVIQQDINKIAFDLRESHKDDFFSVPEDNPLEDFLQTAEETTSPDSDPEQAAMAFICKRLKLNYGKL